MKRYAWLPLIIGLCAAGNSLIADDAAEGESGTAMLVQIDGAIGPATSGFIESSLEQARTDGSKLVIIEMDTPGGLDSSMRDIIKAILASPVPVATYVHPRGARAASAGTYILYASHIAAMTPATNLGAATPVAIGGAPPEQDPASDDKTEDETGDDDETGQENEDQSNTPLPDTAMERKAVNDAVAYIRGLAETRGRNADWAEDAVRMASSLTATRALEQNVIDIVAEDLADLLQQIDGRVVEIDGEDMTLATTGLVVERKEPDWRTRLLGIITNPTLAYGLLLIGIYGLMFEGYNPGAIVPGVVGAICLLLALFAFQLLPVNYAGLALILLGIILIVAEAFVPSFGALGLGGIVAFVIGSVILIDTDVPGFAIARSLIAGIALVGSLTLFGIIYFAVSIRKRPVVSGIEEMRNAVGEAREDFDRQGSIFIHGELWNARSDVSVSKGQKLRVLEIDGLSLKVEPVD